MAALVPGLLAALFYTLAIAWIVRRRPEAGAAGPVEARRPRQGPARVWPVLLVAVVVVGGIYGGVFTPTEGAAVGAVAMLLVGLRSARSAGAGSSTACGRRRRPTAMIFIILLGAEVFNAFLALVQAARPRRPSWSPSPACRPTPSWSR